MLPFLTLTTWVIYIHYFDMSCFLDIWLTMLRCATREFPPRVPPRCLTKWTDVKYLCQRGRIFSISRAAYAARRDGAGTFSMISKSASPEKNTARIYKKSHFGWLLLFNFISSLMSNGRYFSCCEFTSTVTRLFDEASLAWVCSTWECTICSLFAHLHLAS